MSDELCPTWPMEAGIVPFYKPFPCSAHGQQVSEWTMKYPPKAFPNVPFQRPRVSSPSRLRKPSIFFLSNHFCFAPSSFLKAVVPSMGMYNWNLHGLRSIIPYNTKCIKEHSDHLIQLANWPWPLLTTSIVVAHATRCRNHRFIASRTLAVHWPSINDPACNKLRTSPQIASFGFPISSKSLWQV